MIYEGIRRLAGFTQGCTWAEYALPRGPDSEWVKAVRGKALVALSVSDAENAQTA
jgi:hypothetical protein